MIYAEHLFGNSQLGDPVMLEPYGIKIGTVNRVRREIKRILNVKGRPIPRCLKIPCKRETANINMRFRCLADDLPIVLKHPIVPELGQFCAKSGFRTGVTYGKVQYLDCSSEVGLPDGTRARFSDQIATEPMAQPGDSGAILFTAESFEPVGILSSGNELGTFFSKLTNVARENSLGGFYSPISLPRGARPELRCVVSNLVPDGFFVQSGNLLQKNAEQILAELGVNQIRRSPDGGFSVTYSDMIESGCPHLPGDEGSIVTSAKHELIGLAVAGDEKRTFIIKARRAMQALSLDIIKFSESGWRMVHRCGYVKKFCDSCRVSLYPDTEACPFCGRKVHWGSQRIKDYVDEKNQNQPRQ
jgi:hypothetical protein